MLILFFLLFGSFNQSKLDSVIKIIPMSNDIILVKSKEYIKDVCLEDPQLRYNYFVNYSSDKKEAVILLRSRKDPIIIIVETELIGIKTNKYKIKVRNPNPYD